MRRIATTLALALTLLGCNSAVKLQTARAEVLDRDGNPVVSCVLMGVVGELIVDGSFGTALKSRNGNILPVIWPLGFTGRRVGSEVEVLDRDGKVVATTGGTYEILYTRLRFGNEPLVACGEVHSVPPA